MPSAEAPNEKGIVQAYESGKLIRDIFDQFGHANESDFNSILSKCVELHNTGKIDLLSLVERPEFHGISGINFFSGQPFFCKAIPKLKASTKEMMRCVLALVEKGGDDLAANQPNAAFREWCEADLSRAHKVVDAAKEDDSLANKFLTFALTAGNMADAAKGFVERHTDGRRLSAIAALGHMNYATPTLARGALSTLLGALYSKPDDQLFANALMSALDIAAKTSEITCDEALGIVRRVCEAPGTQVHFCCARALWLHDKSLSEEVLASLLQALSSLDPSHKGTIRELDLGLGKLLDTPYADHGIEFVAKLLSAPGGTFNLSEFQSFGRKLLEGPDNRFHRVFVSWMLLGTHALREGISVLLRHVGRGEKPIDLSLQNLELSPVEQVFLCRKAIGYLFLQPVTASSILVSVLRVCDDSVAVEVRGLLFDPLLVNYGGAIRDYLGTIHSNDPAHPHIQAALKQSEEYLDDLKSAGNIKEIHPSEHERQIERIRSHDQMRQAHKEAEKESVFLNLVRRSVILYRKRSITYVEGPNNERRAVEMDLKAHSFMFELPRMEIIDPVGLNYVILIFRAERLDA